MITTVTVAFARDREYEFKFGEDDALPTREEAQQWLERQWLELECSPNNPMGKVLALDRILSVARDAGERRFAANGDWAKDYAKAVAITLDRPAVRIDIPEQVVG